VAEFISGREQISLRPARRRWWCTITGSGGRKASLCTQVMLVEEKQLVIHLQTRCQKTDIGPMIDGGGYQTVDPYRRIGARSERAKESQRYGGRRIPGGERRRIVARAAFPSIYLLEKWDLGSKAGVKMKPSHFRWDGR